MTAAENIVVNPKIEYHAATPAIAIDVRNVNIDIFISSIYVEPLDRFELTACCLQNSCSTTELKWLVAHKLNKIHDSVFYRGFIKF